MTNIKKHLDKLKQERWTSPEEVDAYFSVALKDVVTQTAQAFGGCTTCYGKGHSTVFVSGENRMAFCGCERGETLKTKFHDAVAKEVHRQCEKK